MVSVTDKKTGTTSKELLDTEQWLTALAGQRTPEDVALIRRACAVAEQAHAGQLRASGEPYVQHALAVANILAGLQLDAETLAAAVLHDVVEDTEFTLKQIEKDFGPRVAKLVDGVTKMELIQHWHSGGDSGKRELRQAETLRKMLLAMATMCGWY